MKRNFLSILLIAVVSIALYANTLKNDFVYDDYFTVSNNTLIRDIGNLTKLFKSEDYFTLSGEATYRPVVTLTYFLDYAVFGLKPWGYHLTNILLHAINGVLLYTFLSLIIRPPISGAQRSRFTYLGSNQPLLVSLLYITHPILTETVNAISFREDLLLFLFYIATLSIYLILRQPISNHRPLTTALLCILSCLTCFLALLSKEMAITLPLIIYCYEWIYEIKNRRSIFNRLNMSYIAVALAYIYIRFYYFHPPSEGAIHLSMQDLTATPWLLLSYVKLLIFPVSLSADYEAFTRVRSFFTPLFIVPFIFIISIMVIAFVLKKKEKGISFGIFFFFISLIPVYNIIPLDNLFAERYLYLPAVGGSIVIGEALFYIFKPRIYMILFLAILCIYSVTTIKRNRVWQNDYSLWSDVLGKFPDSSRAYLSLGSSYANSGRFEEAIRHYQSAIKLNPVESKSHYGLGVIYVQQKRFNEALIEFQTALRWDPKLTDAHVQLGLLYAEQGMFDEAIRELDSALQLNPDSADAHYKTGLVYAEYGFIEKARSELETTLRLQPRHLQAIEALESLDSDS